MTLYMFRTIFPSIIMSSRLYIQQQAFVKQILRVLTSKQTAVSVWLLYVQSCTPDDGRKDRPKHVECYSKINKFDTLVHLVGFTIEIILRCTALWTSNKGRYFGETSVTIFTTPHNSVSQKTLIFINATLIISNIAWNNIRSYINMKSACINWNYCLVTCSSKNQIKISYKSFEINSSKINVYLNYVPPPYGAAAQRGPWPPHCWGF